jgi:hypothetical protein
MSRNDAKFSTIKLTQNIILPKGSNKLLDEETGMLNPAIIPNNMQNNESAEQQLGLMEKQLGLMEKQLGELKQQNTDTATKLQNEMAQLKTQLANEQKALGNLTAVTNSDLTTLLKSMLSRISKLENMSK